MVKVLVGNKCDLYNERVVSEEKGRALADSFGMPFFETSSKTRVSIHEVSYSLSVMLGVCDTGGRGDGGDGGEKCDVQERRTRRKKNKKN